LKVGEQQKYDKNENELYFGKEERRQRKKKKRN